MMNIYYQKQKAEVKYNVYNMASGFNEVPDPEADYHGKYEKVANFNPYGLNDAELNKAIENLKASKDEKNFQKTGKHIRNVGTTYCQQFQLTRTITMTSLPAR